MPSLARPTYVYLGPPVTILDPASMGACSGPFVAEVLVPDSFAVVRATVSIHLPHSWQGDVRVRLLHVPTGTSAVLIDRPGMPQTSLGFSADDFGQSAAIPMLLADFAPSRYDDPPVAAPGIARVSGLWRPEAPFAAFAGVSAAGAWRLVLEDCSMGDTGQLIAFSLTLDGAGSGCYPNCDGSTASPFLNVADFICFQNRFAAGGTAANCDGSTTPPTLNVADFICYANAFAAGCSAP